MDILLGINIDMFLGIIASLAGLLLVSIFIAMGSASKDKKKKLEVDMKFNELAAQVKEKNEALKNEIAKAQKLDEEVKNLKARLETQGKKLDEKNIDETKVNDIISKLKSDNAIKDKQIKEGAGILGSNSIEIDDLKKALRKKDDELFSLSETYKGMKEQYDDLERQLVRINQGGVSHSVPVAPAAPSVPKILPGNNQAAPQENTPADSDKSTEANKSAENDQDKKEQIS
ncbi:MAG TPA: hypothetical protein ENH41_02105 [Candidatus Omnitrophica bacterium]|nr:hypothetical protein [Candidatus Omnitrophota bacterium]